MSKGLLIAGGVLGGGALLAYALSREDVRAAASAAYATTIIPMYEAQQEGARQAVAAAKKGVKMVLSVVPQKVLDNFAKYSLLGLIDKYRDGFPWAGAAGIITMESEGDPQAVNKSSGAAGLVQIMPKYPRGLTLAQRLDADASLRVIMKEWRDFLQLAVAAGVTDQRDQWSYVYYGHNQGRGALKAVLPFAAEGFERALQHYRSFPWLKPTSYKDEVAAAKKAGRPARAMTAEEQAAYEAAVATHIKRCIGAARRAADLGAGFAALESSLRGVA